MCEYLGKKVIIATEYYNAFYVNGELRHQAKTDYLDSETLHTLFPDAEYYGAYALEEEGLLENGYPDFLATLPLERCEKYWPR